MRAIQLIIRQIPNLITCLNLFSGCLAVVFAFSSDLLTASVLIFVAGLFDFFDGFVARLLKVHSEFGKSMDSLSDIVSFGLAPSCILFQLMVISVKNSDPGFQFASGHYYETILVSSSFLIAIFSGIRLARFNTDTRQIHSFIGIPTPANAFLIASIPYIIINNSFIAFHILNIWVLVIISVILSYLLICELPMISLKFNNFSIRENIYKYVLLAGSLILIIVCRVSAIPLIFIFYIAVSLLEGKKGNFKNEEFKIKE